MSTAGGRASSVLPFVENKLARVAHSISIAKTGQSEHVAAALTFVLSESQIVGYISPLLEGHLPRYQETADVNHLGTFIAGMLVGGGLIFGSQNYHVLRTDAGVSVVPKLTASFSDIYVDVRSFGVTDWAQHKALAAAIVKAKKEDIFKESSSESVKQGVNNFVNELHSLGSGG
jgi:hypothetical protein